MLLRRPKKMWKGGKNQWCRGGFYHHSMLKFWADKEHFCSRDPQAPVSSERDEWKGGWVGCVHAFSRRSLHTWGEYSLLHDTAHSISHPRNLFFLYLFFLLSCLEKILFILTVSQCKFTVINATQISKLESEGNSSKKNPLPPKDFFFSPSFPHKS